MKPGNYNFQWYEKEDARKVLRVSIGKDGKLRFGRGIRELLPPYIKVGFDKKSRALAIVGGGERDIVLTKVGAINMRTLAAHIVDIGLKLPLSFQMVPKDENEFVGEILPRRKKRSGNEIWQWIFDFDQFLVLYQPLLDALVYRFARSTPLQERKACAMEALFKALSDYHAAFGDLGEYVERCVRDALLDQNKQYIQTYHNRSLDAPLTQEDRSDPLCLHDLIPDAAGGGLDEAEGRIMDQQFFDSLAPEEKRLLNLMHAGFRVAEIAAELGIEEELVQIMGEGIGRKRSKFYAV